MTKCSSPVVVVIVAVVVAIVVVVVVIVVVAIVVVVVVVIVVVADVVAVVVAAAVVTSTSTYNRLHHVRVHFLNESADGQRDRGRTLWGPSTFNDCNYHVSHDKSHSCCCYCCCRCCCRCCRCCCLQSRRRMNIWVFVLFRMVIGLLEWFTFSQPNC